MTIVQRRPNISIILSLVGFDIQCYQSAVNCKYIFLGSQSDDAADAEPDAPFCPFSGRYHVTYLASPLQEGDLPPACPHLTSSLHTCPSPQTATFRYATLLNYSYNNNFYLVMILLHYIGLYIYITKT